MKLTFAVVYERTPNNYSAYAPDLPGCVAVGATRKEVRGNIRAAAAFHIEGIRQDGDPIPEPRLSVRQAMDFHAAALAEADQPPPSPETKAALVEVEVGSAGYADAPHALAELGGAPGGYAGSA